jgi:hypothetical protein
VNVRLSGLLVVALLALATSGCAAGGELVRTAVETHVRADGSAERRILVAAEGGESRPITLERSWSVPEPGVSLEGRSFVRGREFEDLGREGGMRLDTTDRGFWITYRFEDRLEGLLEQSPVVVGATTYKLVMPGRISEAPGARVQGAVAIWELDEGEAGVRAESLYVRWWAVGLAVVGLAASVALVIGGRAAAPVKALGLWLWTGDVRRRSGGENRVNCERNRQTEKDPG